MFRKKSQKEIDGEITTVQLTKKTRQLLNVFKLTHNLRNHDEAIKMLLQNNV